MVCAGKQHIQIAILQQPDVIDLPQRPAHRAGTALLLRRCTENLQQRILGQLPAARVPVGGYQLFKDVRPQDIARVERRPFVQGLQIPVGSVDGILHQLADDDQPVCLRNGHFFEGQTPDQNAGVDLLLGGDLVGHHGIVLFHGVVHIHHAPGKRLVQRLFVGNIHSVSHGHGLFGGIGDGAGVVFLIHAVNSHIPALHQMLNGGDRVEQDIRRQILGQPLRCLVDRAQIVVIIDDLIHQPFLHTEVAVIDRPHVLDPLGQEVHLLLLFLPNEPQRIPHIPHGQTQNENFRDPHIGVVIGHHRQTGTAVHLPEQIAHGGQRRRKGGLPLPVDDGKQKHIQQIKINFGEIQAVGGAVIQHEKGDEQHQIFQIRSQHPQQTCTFIIELVPDAQPRMPFPQKAGAVPLHVGQRLPDDLLRGPLAGVSKLPFQPFIGKNDLIAIRQRVVHPLHLFAQHFTDGIGDLRFGIPLAAGEMIQPRPVGLAARQLLDALDGIAQIGQSHTMVAPEGYRAVPEGIQAFFGADHLRRFPRAGGYVVQPVQPQHHDVPFHLLGVKSAALLPLVQHQGANSPRGGGDLLRHRRGAGFSEHLRRGKIEQPPLLHGGPGQQQILQTGAKPHRLPLGVLPREISVEGPQQDGHVRLYASEHLLHRGAVIGEIVPFKGMGIPLARISAPRQHIQPVALFMQFYGKGSHHP